jgi:hypothetical protein
MGVVGKERLGEGLPNQLSGLKLTSSGSSHSRNREPVHTCNPRVILRYSGWGCSQRGGGRNA